MSAGPCKANIRNSLSRRPNEGGGLNTCFEVTDHEARDGVEKDAQRESRLMYMYLSASEVNHMASVRGTAVDFRSRQERIC